MVAVVATESDVAAEHTTGIAKISLSGTQTRIVLLRITYGHTA